MPKADLPIFTRSNFITQWRSGISYRKEGEVGLWKPDNGERNGEVCSPMFRDRLLVGMRIQGRQLIPIWYPSYQGGEQVLLFTVHEGEGW